MLYGRCRVRRHPSWIWCPQRALMKPSLWAGQRGHQSPWSHGRDSTVLSGLGCHPLYSTPWLETWGFLRAPSPFPVLLLRVTEFRHLQYQRENPWTALTIGNGVQTIVKSIQTTVDMMMKSTPCLLHHSRYGEVDPPLFTSHNITLQSKLQKTRSPKTQGAVLVMHSNMTKVAKTVYKE